MIYNDSPSYRRAHILPNLSIQQLKGFHFFADIAAITQICKSLITYLIISFG